VTQCSSERGVGLTISAGTRYERGEKANGKPGAEESTRAKQTKGQRLNGQRRPSIAAEKSQRE
jgi:hypothetical protein